MQRANTLHLRHRTITNLPKEPVRLRAFTYLIDPSESQWTVQQLEDSLFVLDLKHLYIRGKSNSRRR